MKERLPDRIEAIIRLHEEKLTEELRELTGRDDITVYFDREPILGWPTPASVLGRCPHGVDLDRDFCPHGCRV